MKLAAATLAALPAGIAVPAYDPAAIEPGIVHLGLGGFHRAHMARYTDALMGEQRGTSRWGIVGVGMLAGDRLLRDALVAQDCLYTLTERDAADERTRAIGSLAGMLLAQEEPGAVLAAIDRARIVSLTVTEHGYCLNAASKRLDPAHPAIAADLAAPDMPRSAIGIVVEALRRRKAAGRPPFTAMSCDNIQHNGRVLRQAVLDLAALRDPALAGWIAAHGAFPNTMVDRITPVTRAEDAAALARRTGVADDAPVFCETFTQWVIEDEFADGRPEWERVGAQIVPDVTPYEAMKLRLLNASHLAIAGPARLIGYTDIDESMRDPDLAAFMTRLMDRETEPTLAPVPGVDLAAYKRTVAERFANPTIRDTVERVNTDAALNYLLDPVRDRRRAGEPVPLLGFAVAAWLRRMRGIDEAGATIDVRHPLRDLLRERAIEGGADPRPMLAIAPLFGDLAQDDGFVGPVADALAVMYARGMKAALRRLVAAG